VEQSRTLHPHLLDILSSCWFLSMPDILTTARGGEPSRISALYPGLGSSGTLGNRGSFGSSRFARSNSLLGSREDEEGWLATWGRHFVAFLAIAVALLLLLQPSAHRKVRLGDVASLTEALQAADFEWHKLQKLQTDVKRERAELLQVPPPLLPTHTHTHTFPSLNCQQSLPACHHQIFSLFLAIAKFSSCQLPDSHSSTLQRFFSFSPPPFCVLALASERKMSSGMGCHGG